MYRQLSKRIQAPKPGYHPGRHITSDLTNLQDQTIILNDGRTLGYAQYGDFDGRPLIYLHGFPSSRLEAKDLEKLAKKRNIHVIAPDRPGAGLSTLRPPRTTIRTFPPRKLSDYPSDLLALIDHLNLPSVSILGGSGGGPFALACAKSLPANHLRRVGLFGSAGPWVAPLASNPRQGQDDSKFLQKDIKLSSWIIYLFATYAPGLSIAIGNALVSSSDWLTKTKMVESWLDKWLESVLISASKAKSPPGDSSSPRILPEKERSEIPAMRENLLRVFNEGFAQGTEGPIRDIHIYTQPWGFRFEDVDFPVWIWHGTKDSNSPVSQIRYMAERIPKCTYVEYPDLDHYMMGTKIEEVLDIMMSEKV